MLPTELLTRTSAALDALAALGCDYASAARIIARTPDVQTHRALETEVARHQRALGAVAHQRRTLRLASFTRAAELTSAPSATA